jgi:hypothetical protein
MSAARIIRYPSLIAYGVLSVVLGMALFAIGSVMTDPTYEQVGYLVSEVFTLLCLLISAVFTFMMRSNKTCPRGFTVYGLALAVSVLCWLGLWIRQPFNDSDRILLSLVALHGLLWGARCVTMSAQSELSSGRSIALVLAGATACAAGIMLATQSGTTRLAAVTAAACYMLCLGLQLFVVFFLITGQSATVPLAEG